MRRVSNILVFELRVVISSLKCLMVEKTEKVSNPTCVDPVHTKNSVDQAQARDQLYHFNIHYIILTYTISLYIIS